MDLKEKLKRSVILSEAWKKRDDYLGELRNSPLYNSHRAFKNTLKGKKIGYCDEWSDYRVFYRDMIDSHFDGARLCRVDKSKGFSKENCMWVNDEILSSHRNNTVYLECNGEKRTLREWSQIYELPYNGIKQRYYKGKNYTPHEIIFGKKRSKKVVVCASELSMKQIRTKSSKMISQYKLKDKKKGLQNDIGNDIDWFIWNILVKDCVYCGSDSRIGADRVDNSKGHTKDNVVPACYSCNIMRGNNFSFDEMKKIGRFVKSEILDKR